MPKSQVKCPRCQQPAIVDVEQVFDVTTEPQAKQHLLSGTANFVNCQACGYSGMLATPILYHDNEKELLLTFFPPELNTPLNEQEKIIGPMINQIVNNLPSEKRKAYLFSPKSFLTFQSMIETILGADGITPEMIKAQQSKANLIEKLISASSDDLLKSMIKDEPSLFDTEFFA
ncbi:CpXC domain-containing protein, partial [Chloroflexota bacterium]